MPERAGAVLCSIVGKVVGKVPAMLITPAGRR